MADTSPQKVALLILITVCLLSLIIITFYFAFSFDWKISLPKAITTAPTTAATTTNSTEIPLNTTTVRLTYQSKEDIDDWLIRNFDRFLNKRS